MLPMLPCILETLSDVNIAYALRRFVSKKGYRTTRRLATTTWLRRVRDFPLLLHPAAEAWLGRRNPTRFRFPDNQPTGFMRVRAGYTIELPKAPYNGSNYFTVDPGFYIFPEFEDADVPPFGLNPVWSLNHSKKIGHLLNRIGYGPQLDDVTQIEKMGIEPYIESQLSTAEATWQNNEKLQQKES